MTLHARPSLPTPTMSAPLVAAGYSHLRPPPAHGPHAGEDPARIRATIARSPLFAALPISAIEDLTARVAVRRVAAGAVVVSQDEVGDSLFVIMSGRIKVMITGESGREVTLSLLRSGESFGEMALFDESPRSANCVAVEPTTLLALSREDLMRHVQAHPRTAERSRGRHRSRRRRA